MGPRGAKILKYWFGIMAVYLILLQVLDHVYVPPSLFAIFAVETLSFLLCVAIARHEPNTKNKMVFINFALFFATAFLGMLGTFLVPSVFPENRFFKHLYDQYFSYGAYGLLLTFCLAYLTIDVLFREYRIGAKYLLAITLAGGLFWLYFHPFVEDPMYSYHSQDIRDWKAICEADSAFRADTGREGSPEELAAGVHLYLFDGKDTVAVLQPEARERRVAELFPYLGENFIPLLTKPIQMYMVQMSMACVGFILLFFGYLYMKDPPQGAYIEKIMFLWLVFCSMEVLHGWSAIKAVEWRTVSQILAAGQYASNGALVLIAIYLSLRLRFITSVKGEFYESELLERPAGITRWRDALDNLVIEKFLNRQTLLGRMFAVPEEQNHHI